jgi:hypothetical protein
MYTDSTWCTNCRCTGLLERRQLERGTSRAHTGTAPKASMFRNARRVRYDGEACRGCNARNQSGFWQSRAEQDLQRSPLAVSDKNMDSQPHVGATYRHWLQNLLAMLDPHHAPAFRTPRSYLRPSWPYRARTNRSDTQPSPPARPTAPAFRRNRRTGARSRRGPR